MSIKRRKEAPLFSQYDVVMNKVTSNAKIQFGQMIPIGYTPDNYLPKQAAMNQLGALLTSTVGWGSYLNSNNAHTTNGSTTTEWIYGTAIDLFINVTAVSGTSPTLDFSIQTNDPASNLNFEVETMPQITAIGKYRLRIDPSTASIYTIAWTLGGTTPSFTFSIGYTSK